MELILLEKVENLGTVGDVVKVRSGYGRNFLLPRGKATLATAANKAKFEEIRAELEKKTQEERDVAQARADRLQGINLTLAGKVSTEENLFGSIGTYEIVEALEREGIEIERSEVRLPDGPLRTLGEHEVGIALHADVKVVLRVLVVAEET